MKYLLILLSVSLSINLKAQTVWLEDFSGLPNGTVNDAGSTTWDILGAPTGYFEVRGERIAANNTNEVMTWRSEVIDISTAGLINISVLLDESSLHEENQDYIILYYVLDEGISTPFEVNFSHFRYGEVVAFTSLNSYLSGSTVQIIAEVRNNAGDEYMYFDNIEVYQAPPATLYARNNGYWTDANTWSATIGGSSCNCIPDVNTNVYLDNYDLLLNSNQGISNVYLINDANLNIENALLFVYGSQFTTDASSSMREQVTEVKVIFIGDANATFTNNSSAGVLLDELDTRKAATLTIDLDVDICNNLIFNNSSTITITDDIGVTNSNVSTDANFSTAVNFSNYHKPVVDYTNLVFNATEAGPV
ncbi:MAG: hypothetical protein ACOCXH_16365, partial [Cyclobacteriaceae bacterium]